MEPIGGTALIDAVYNAANDLLAQNDSEAINALVVMTDGQENESSYTVDDLNNLLQSHPNQRLVIFTIAFGSDADEQLLQEIANIGNGQFRRASETDIEELYREEHGYFLFYCQSYVLLEKRRKVICVPSYLCYLTLFTEIPMTTIRTELQQKAQSAMFQYAIMRWESAVVVALTLVLFFLLRRPFPWWPPFGWPILGLVGLILLVYSSLNDAETNARVLSDLFREEFDPRPVRDKELRNDVEQALEYQRRIEAEVQKQRPGQIRDRLEGTANQLTDWLKNIYALALRVDAYRADTLLARERDAVPKELTQVRQQRQRESNPSVQKQLDDLIASKEKHQQTLDDLDARMKQAALQLEQSLTALATVYGQVQLIDAQSVGSGQAERLQSDIREQVERLNDLVDSINEVYDYSTKKI
jgi:hypothetical protein